MRIAARPDTSFFRMYDADEIEFLQAVDRYKREKSRPFPTWAEVLEVLKSLGYRKEPASKEVNYSNKEDEE